MAVTPKKELFKYYDQLKKLKFICADISFLKRCLKNKVFPNFMKIKYPTSNERIKRLKHNAMSAWLKSEIKYHHSRVTNINIELYAMHKNIVSDLNKYAHIFGVHQAYLNYSGGSPNNILFEKWIEYDNCCREYIQLEIHEKISVLNRKFNALKDQTRQGLPQVKQIEDFVVNESSVHFSERQLRLLNKGLKYVPQNQKYRYVILL